MDRAGGGGGSDGVVRVEIHQCNKQSLLMSGALFILLWIHSYLPVMLCQTFMQRPRLQEADIICRICREMVHARGSEGGVVV